MKSLSTTPPWLAIYFSSPTSADVRLLCNFVEQEKGDILEKLALSQLPATEPAHVLARRFCNAVRIGEASASSLPCELIPFSFPKDE